ncbi:hypothetical protein SCB71_04885 [Herbiconiux sp. KACC 21604]|uniref:hypothetical protein n=1 Tax=unclassified Herbiconiux TaxID=2618217 RepID=UPI00149101E7|nr:hypothetical protein [Herbiconiux sp. SALV-R1]QJU52685.1 hypothetical protein HL652_02865 [Herbiconiux sp. SALV-R1]WPO87583.1 hypothetical protein SCB71_04885 [Herbiconiux sp. KACC 21604]
MAVDDEVVAKAHSWREEVDQLFGLRWDTLVEWVVITWVSVWLYSSWVAHPDAAFPSEGPIEWTAGLFRALSIDPPGWLTGVTPWLTDASRSWLLGLSVVLSAVFVTLSVKRRNRVGLRFLALVMLVIALEIGDSIWPVFLILALAAVPAICAAVAGVVENLRADDRRDDLHDGFFLPSIVLRQYVEGVLLLFAMPVLAPFILLYRLVTSYRVELPYDPSAELARLVAEELEEGSRSVQKTDALLAVSALAAIQTAGSSPRSSRDIASMLHHRVRDRRELRQRLERDRRDREWDALRRR